tara:strand:+ start:243 stop:578 length:336 start_codon:yes stop_codon:yes gene_type:complete
MSDFFKSDQVQSTIAELTSLQQQLVTEMPYLPMMKPEQKKEHLRTLKSFLEKQKLFFFRISLSNDKEALEMKNRLMEATKMFGVNDEMNNMDAFFAKLDDTIKDLEESIDK